jgi:hypothetical protein
VGTSTKILQNKLPKPMIFQVKIYHSHGTVDQVIPIEWARKLESVLDKLSNALVTRIPNWPWRIAKNFMISKLVVRIKKVPSRTFFLFYSHNND